MREVLDAGAMALTVKESEVADMLRALTAKPALVITDSQAVREVAGGGAGRHQADDVFDPVCAL